MTSESNLFYEEELAEGRAAAQALAGTRLTVVCREEGYPDNILIYAVTVKRPRYEADVQAAVEEARSHDLGEAPNPMKVLFAFDGDLSPSQDWRDE